ncbi:MAG: ArsC family reductase [Porticoccaceae bacterium]|nr:ArsC family reductase [Porticoccaceae bacterium]
MKPSVKPGKAKLYGIKNCDTVKKARKWLDQQGIDHQFHDFRADGLSAQQINAWRKQVDWETLVNKRSTTWKQLDDATKAAVNAGTNTETVNAVLLANPTLIKRPVLEYSGQAYVGFKAAEYEAIFK